MKCDELKVYVPQDGPYGLEPEEGGKLVEEEFRQVTSQSGGVQMIRTRLQGGTPFFPNMLNNGKVEVCLKEDVDKILAEKDKVIAEKDAEICRLKNGIAPKYSDKTLQDRLNEVCEKHGVSTLQDLDWAFCESEKRYTKDCIEAHKMITHHKYKRCLDKAAWCEATALWCYQAACTLPKGFKATLHGKPVMIEPARLFKRFELLYKWEKRWLELADKFKEEK